MSYLVDIDDFDPDTKLPMNAHYHSIFELYVFADRYQVVCLINQLIDTLVHGFPFLTDGPKPGIKQVLMPTANEIEYVWINTPTGSPLRKVVIHWHMYHVTRDFLLAEGVGHELLTECPEFAKEMVVALLQATEIARTPRDCPSCKDKTSLHVQK